MRKILLFALFIAFLAVPFSLHAQYKLYESQFNGGVTAGGYSPGIGDIGTGNFTIHIPSGSSIRQAYLLAGKQGPVNSVTVTLNGNNVTFDATTAVTSFTSLYGGVASVHAADVTSVLNASDTSYALYFPGGNTSDTYTDFYLYVAYNNPSMAMVSSAVFLNTHDFADSITFNMNLTMPLLPIYDAGLSIGAGYMCSVANDGEYIYVNSNYIGKIGGADINSSTNCGGTMGSFYYEQGLLHGLNDDSADLAMNGTDALSNVKSLITSGNTSLNVLCVHDSVGSITDNSIWLMTLTYGIRDLGVSANDESTVTLWPNPVRDVLNITLNDNKDAELTIYDVVSRLEMQQTFAHSTSLNTASLESGIYLYELRNRNGLIKKGKLIKE